MEWYYVAGVGVVCGLIGAAIGRIDAKWKARNEAADDFVEYIKRNNITITSVDNSKRTYQVNPDELEEVIRFGPPL